MSATLELEPSTIPADDTQTDGWPTMTTGECTHADPVIEGLSECCPLCGVVLGFADLR